MGLSNPGYHWFAVGDARCCVLYDGWLDHPLAGFLGGPDAEIDRFQRDNFLSTDRWPMDENCLYIETGSERILIDTGLGHHKWFGQHTGLLAASMAEAGISPESITLVALTHADTDHVFGLLQADGSKAFPNARLAISKLEFDHWVDGLVIAGKSPNNDWRAVTQPTLAAYRDEVVWLEDEREVANGLFAVATPGHSPGHFSFRLESGEHSMIVLGDAVHHQVIELSRPEWKFLWDFDPGQGVESKKNILGHASRRNALCHGFHFEWPGLGRIRDDGDGYVWVPAPMMR